MRDKIVIPEEKHRLFLSQIAKSGFFGVIETFFEDGRIVLVKKHETLVGPDVDRLIQTV